MTLSRTGLALAAALFTFAAAAKADDTADFLKPENWEGRADIWKLDGKSVVGETTEDPKYNTFFCSKTKYADFEMTFKVQLREGTGNSGVQVRSVLKDAKKFTVTGPQVDAGKGYWGSLYGEGFGGMMQASKPDDIKKHVKETEFNDYAVTVKGKHVTVKIAGEVMVDGDFVKMPDDGIIAFQCHGGYPKMRVEFKDITFKVLKADK